MGGWGIVPDQISQPALPPNRLSCLELQKAFVVDDSFPGVYPTYKIGNQGIIYFHSVTKHRPRCGIDGFVVDKVLSASFDGCAEVRCFRARDCATIISHDLHPFTEG